MKRRDMISVLVLFLSLSVFCTINAQDKAKDDSNIVWLDSLGISPENVIQEWGTAKPNKSCIEKPITIGKKVYLRGVGTHAKSRMKFELNGEAERFQAYAGVDDEVTTHESTINFEIHADGKKLYDSGVMKPYDKAKFIDVDLTGVKTLYLIVENGGDTNHYDHADWADAKFVMKKDATGKPKFVPRKFEKAEILTPPAPKTPRINGPSIIGAGINHDIIYYIPATGERPIKFSVEKLPEGLKLKSEKGIITGKINKAGSYTVNITAENKLGKNSREIEFAVGKGIALTPPMGWNSWNCWGVDVDADKIKAAADSFEASGLINHGWTYINIDDCWHGERTKDSGEITSNKKFPDMKALSDYIHDKGLKFGVYTDMGIKTCAGYPGSKGHEVSDVKTYSKWGVDYVKVDWCNTEGMEPKPTYKIFGDAIKNHATRDIVFSICNWGVDNPWEWGAEVGGNSWRTTGDITDDWCLVKEIGFKRHAGLSKYVKPGHWNDPDMLVVGYVGWSKNLRPTNLTPNQQYSHISLWAMISSPLLIGCDLTRLDDFTKNLLTNDEVIAVSQDKLGRAADKVDEDKFCEVWSKDLYDGSKAVGVFHTNTLEYAPVDQPDITKFKLVWDKLGISGKYTVRDLWRQKDLGDFDNEIDFTIPSGGVMLVKLTPKK